MFTLKQRSDLHDPPLTPVVIALKSFYLLFYYECPFFIFDGLESMDPISNSLYEVVLRGYSWAVSEWVMVEWGPSVRRW